jgi:uncharacterized protein (DUF2249 family)
MNFQDGGIMNIINKCITDLGTNLVQEKDKLILQVFKDLGEDIFIIANHQPHRLRRTRIQGTSYETFYLDGNLILELHDLEVNQEENNNAVKIKASMKYRRFK